MRENDEMILSLRDKGGLTLEQIGQKFGLTRQRIHQIAERARLRNEIDKLAEENPLLLLSARARNVLRRQNIDSVEQMRGLTRRRLAMISGCGEKTADEIMRLVNSHRVEEK